MLEKFVFSTLTQLISNLIYLFSFYLLFQKLNATYLGIWGFLHSIISLGFIFTDLGIDVIHYQYSGKQESSKFFATYFIIKISIIGINVLFTFLILTFLDLWYSSFLFLILLIFFSRILTQITLIFLVNLKSRIKVFKVEIPSFLITIGKSIIITYLYFNFIQSLASLIYIAASNFIFDIIFFILIQILSKQEIEFNKIKKQLAYKYLKDASPFFLFSIISVISSNLGLIIINYSLGYESLGFVSFVSLYIIPMFLIISNSIITIYLPLFSKLYEQNDMILIKKIIYKIEKYSSILFLSIIIIVIINGNLLFSIFIPNYINSVPILSIMIFIPYLLSISQPYSYYFIASKKQKIQAFINSITRILIIILMILLIPSFGTIGYAISQLIPWILWCLLNHYFSKKIFKINVQKGIILQLLLAIATIIIGYMLKIIFVTVFLYIPVLVLIISSIISIILFICLLILFKELKKVDFKFFMKVFKFEEYIKSLKREFDD